MADVRKEGPHYITLRRIYRDKKEGFGRVLLYAEGKMLKADVVARLGLTVADEKSEKPAPKGRKAK